MEVGLDGSGCLLDVGCGPGILALALAEHFEEVIGLDPDAQMLAEGARHGTPTGSNTRWVQAFAEDIAALDLGKFRLVTFGQSFHWTDRERVAKWSMTVWNQAVRWHSSGIHPRVRPQPEGPGYPPIPHEAIRAVIARYLGTRRRAGQGVASLPSESHEEMLARTRFGVPRSLFCAGRDDIVQDSDGVLANYLSTSFAAPHLFGELLACFEADVRTELAARSVSGLFWDWPGDTQILLAGKVG